MPNPSTHYLGITIGPVVQTMLNARKIRELWAASYLFSLLMQQILLYLKTHKKVQTILTPDASVVDKVHQLYGAGVYSDRCFAILKKQEVFNEQDMADLKGQAIATLSSVFKNNNAVKDFLEHYLHIYGVQIERTAQEILVPETADADTRKQTSLLLQMNHLLDNLELQKQFMAQPKMEMIQLLDKSQNIETLYQLAFEEDQKSGFVAYANLTYTEAFRLKTLLEISTAEFNQEEAYPKIVTKRITDELVKQQKRSLSNVEDQAQELVIQDLKKTFKDNFKARHKYVAVVYADGDNIGQTIGDLRNDTKRTESFSAALRAFYVFAAEEISGFGALPVYAGGDDLHFIAPLQNKEGEHFFQLIDALNEKFEALKDLGNATLSFGVSITYYKFPLGESQQIAYDALEKKSKKIQFQTSDLGLIKKNGLSWQVQKGSGQQFGTTLPMGSSTYKHFVNLLADYRQLELGFLSSMMYKLDQLSLLLADAAQAGNLSHFFNNHFNEGQDKAFLAKVKDLLDSVFQEFTHLGVPAKISMVYSILRFVKFLNEPDHD